MQRTEEEVRGVLISRPVLPYCITKDKLLKSTELLFPHPSKEADTIHFASVPLKDDHTDFFVVSLYLLGRKELIKDRGWRDE